VTAEGSIDRTELVGALRVRVQPRSGRGQPTTSLAALRTVDAVMRERPNLGREGAVTAVLVRAVERLASGTGPVEGLGSADRGSVARAATSLLGLDGRTGQTSGARHVAAAAHLYVSERQVRRLVPPILAALAAELLELEVVTPPTFVERQRPAWWSEPHELPPSPALLVGRDDDLGHLRRMIAGAPPVNGRARTIVVHGPPGVGKTTLLGSMAHELASAHPDGRVWLNLDAVGGRVGAEAIARRLLRSVGAGGEHGTSEGAAAAMCSAFAGRQLLVVVDGAWDEDQVEAATPPSAASLVLVATRAPLGALDGAVSHRVDPLPSRAAVLLLREVIGLRSRDDGPLLDIAEACSGLPLALRIAAARIVGDGLSPGDLAARLAQPGGAARELRYRTKDLPALVGQTVAGLSEAALDALDAARDAGGWLEPGAASNEVIRSGLVQKLAGGHRLLGVFATVLPARSARDACARPPAGREATELAAHAEI